MMTNDALRRAAQLDHPADMLVRRQLSWWGHVNRSDGLAQEVTASLRSVGEFSRLGRPPDGWFKHLAKAIGETPEQLEKRSWSDREYWSGFVNSTKCVLDI